MNVEELFAKIPLWGVLLASLAIFFLATELGFQAGGRMRERLAGEKDDIRPGPFASAALSLAAFMMALSYGTVQSRLHEVKQVALNEANAIGTVYRRTDQLPEAYRAQVREILREYVSLRAQAVEADAGPAAGQTIGRSRNLQNELWHRAVTIENQEPGRATSQFVDSVSELITLYNKRNTLALQYGMPMTAWLVLYGLTVLAMGMGGYTNGYAGSLRSVTLAVAIAMAYSVVLMLVVGLDRTHVHLSTITESVMVELQESILGTRSP